MPRREFEIMEDWEFAWEKPETGNFHPVNLPHDWAIDAPIKKDVEQGGAQAFRDRWGVGWYRKIQGMEEVTPGYRYLLEFGGIYENSTIWLNGVEAGGRKYGYSSFTLDITDFVRAGENEILIRVDNTARPADRWYSGAGIYRTVKWLEVENPHFEKNEVIVKTEIVGKDAEIRIHTGVKAPVKAVLKRENMLLEAMGEAGDILFEVRDAFLWSAEHPNLYDLTLSLPGEGGVSDSASMKLGIRKYEMIPGRGLFVNGERVILKGVCVHQDVGCRGNAAKKEIWRERLLNLKEMGCNAVRTAHHIFSEEFLDLCDEFGFYVYEECFDKWTGGMYGRYFETEWKKDVETMVKRDRNRACVFIWGTGNEVENQGQNTMLAILRDIKTCILTMDDSRPITCAMNPHFKRESNIDVSQVKDIQKFVDETDDREIYEMSERLDRMEKIGEIVDVLACNYQEQWYDRIHERMPDKLILGTETFQYFKGNPEQLQNFTEENPALVPKEKDYVIGSMIWTGIDYLGESMGYPSKGWSGSMIRTNGVRKPGYYILQSYWSDKPMVHFSVMDYSLADEMVKEHWDMPSFADHWHFPQFHKALIPYIVATNCEEVKLYLNGKRYYLEKPSECKNHIIKGFLPYQPGTVEVIGYRKGQEVCRQSVITPGPAVKLGFDRRRQPVLSEKGYEILLTVYALDREGHPYFRESSYVHFSVEGPAEIIAVDNGNLMSNEPYQEDSIHMHHGAASTMIRLTGETGRVVVKADTEGMESAELVIPVKERMS